MKRLALFSLAALLLASCSGKEESTNYLKGIVVYPSDVYSTGASTWEQRLLAGNLNLMAIHADTIFEPMDSLKKFVESDCGRELLSACDSHGIKYEFEIHALEHLLPRELFNEHPEYFRMDSEGNRVQQYNMCFTCEEAYGPIRERMHEWLTWLKPTTHRYLFWTDDIADTFCQCENCRQYSCSELSLIYENHLIDIIREVDPEATVAHLAYSNTFDAPVKVEAKEGVFLEYAPMNRDRSQPIADEARAQFEKNLEVFSKGGPAHILEYWLDESLTCGYQRHHPVKLNWIPEYCRRDVEYYHSVGATSVTTFATWLDADYDNAFGTEHTLQVFKEYGEALGE